MEHFELDNQLAKGNFILGEFDTSLVLLMNNKVAPWFVLVPKVTGVSELYELDVHTQASLTNEINILSKFLKQQFVVDKMNVAAIGNIVNQLHIHVVARKTNDHCWPGVVWGTEYSEPYQEEEVNKLTSVMSKTLSGFKAHSQDKN